MIVADVECYPNDFFVVAGRPGAWMIYELDAMNSLKRVLESADTVVTFNGRRYDIPMIKTAIAGATNEELKSTNDLIIEQGTMWWELPLPQSNLKTNHIDLFHVAPLSASLKMYGARLDVPTIQDLPYDPGETLNVTQKKRLREYCINDCEITWNLYHSLKEELDLRRELSKRYDLDLLSASDAQCAEKIIVKEVEKRGVVPKKIKPKNTYRYKPPEWIDLFWLAELPDLIGSLTFPFNYKRGKYDAPEIFKNKIIGLADGKYQIGIGGLHSVHKSGEYVEDLYEVDAAAYYPSIILRNELRPRGVGRAFLSVYRQLVERRIKAKSEGDKAANESLKIAINGTFGKLGNQYAKIYDPGLVLDVTLTGQLGLLMLIESMLNEGIDVVSANTDGIFVKGNEQRIEVAMKVWEKDTGLVAEKSHYHWLAMRDVNNYIAKKESGEYKTKGSYANRNDPFYLLRKNPTGSIAIRAAIDKIEGGRGKVTAGHVNEYLYARRVSGGAVWKDQYLGSVVRWYNAQEGENIHYLSNWNKVGSTDRAVPCLKMPDQIPKDLHYPSYEQERDKILKAVGF